MGWGESEVDSLTFSVEGNASLEVQESLELFVLGTPNLRHRHYIIVVPAHLIMFRSHLEGTGVPIPALS